MTFLVRGNRHRHRILFTGRAVAARQLSTVSTASRTLDQDHQIDSIVKQSSRHRTLEDPTAAMASVETPAVSLIPDLFTSLPPIRDHLCTESSNIQDATVQQCLPLLSALDLGVSVNDYGIPNLDRKRHIAFLHRSLQKLPAPYLTADASRPWMFYWALNALATMGEDVSPYREPLLATVRPIQNATGGFGGGNGQVSHLAPTYAILLSLAIVGGHQGLDLIDRRAMWKWLGSLKQPDGGFQMAVGGEEDVRGAYCAMVIITLLNLPLELPMDSPSRSRECMSLHSGLPEWIARCQTFEGGISARPNAEAHGAYTFCALACLCILGEPHDTIPKYLNVPCLISWLSARQYAPEGGFSGRTNKLVDGCYSHWVGGCWPLIEACLDNASAKASVSGITVQTKVPSAASVGGSLYNREGLIRYILCCCQDQSKRGGLRDKPSKNSDSYHTCYVLAGLSSAQTKWHFNTSTIKTEIVENLNSPFQWISDAIAETPRLYDEKDLVSTLHPVFVIPERAVEKTRVYFTSKRGF